MACSNYTYIPFISTVEFMICRAALVYSINVDVGCWVISATIVYTMIALHHSLSQRWATNHVDPALYILIVCVLCVELCVPSCTFGCIVYSQITNNESKNHQKAT